MSNWRVHKTLSLTILGISIAVLFGFGGIIGIQSLSDKVFNMFTWKQIIGASLGYVFWAFNTLIRG